MVRESAVSQETVLGLEQVFTLIGSIDKGARS